MEVLKLTFPDGESIVTHDLDDAHLQKIIRHWVDRHSDEYELPAMQKGQVNERMRDKETGEWLYTDGYGNEVRSRDADAHVRPGSQLTPMKHHVERVLGIGESTGKKPPNVKPQLIEMPEEQYRALTTYRYFETCKVAV